MLIYVINTGTTEDLIAVVCNLCEDCNDTLLFVDIPCSIQVELCVFRIVSDV